MKRILKQRPNQWVSTTLSEVPIQSIGTSDSIALTHQNDPLHILLPDFSQPEEKQLLMTMYEKTENFKGFQEL